jgi:hypothetical protein
MGGIDWSGLGLQVNFFGIDDVEGLVSRLNLIKLHTPKEPMT